MCHWIRLFCHKYKSNTVLRHKRSSFLVPPSIILKIRYCNTFTPSHAHYCHILTTVTHSLLSHPHYCHILTTVTHSLLSHPHYCHILTTVTHSLLSHPHYCHTLTTVTHSLLSHTHCCHTLTTVTHSLMSHLHTLSLTTVTHSPSVLHSLLFVLSLLLQLLFFTDKILLQYHHLWLQLTKCL